MGSDIELKYELLGRELVGLGSVLVAYSGGVDSTFLLKAAVDCLGAGKVLACIGVSASLARSQYERAIEAAEQIGAEVVEVAVHEADDENYSANKADRCFYCKSHLYEKLKDVARERGFEAVVCGSNFDDKSDYRPGNRAAEVLGVKSPLMDAGLSKEDIRALSRELGLVTADVPASPCLASRISYGLEITAERLGQVERAEEFLRGLGLVEFRVRHHGDVARIEVLGADMPKVTGEESRRLIAGKFKEIGFKFVSVDLEGFRSGSLNKTLGDEEKME